jgi:non-specific serine/threonine protein kinase
LGAAWRTLGERERAADHLRAAAADYARAFGADAEPTLTTRYALVRTLAYGATAEGFAEARRELEETDRLAGDRLQGDNEVALRAAIARGQFHFQQLQMKPALAAHLRADRLQRELRPDDAHMASLVRGAIADTMLRMGRTEEAIARLRAMLSDPMLDAAHIGESGVAGHRITLARALRGLGRCEEALPLAQAAADASERVLGPDNYSTLVQLSTVASIHDAAGHCDRALPVERTVRERMAARYGALRQATLIETGNLGFMEYDCGDREAGLDDLRQAEQGLREHFGAGNVAAHSFRFGLAKALAEQGRYREALEMANGLDVAALTAGDSTPGWKQRLEALRGRILVLSGDAAEGRRLLREALPALQALGTEEPAEIAQMQRLLSGDAGTGTTVAAGTIAGAGD